jgi:hypothetical protein
MLKEPNVPLIRNTIQNFQELIRKEKKERKIQPKIKSERHLSTTINKFI